MKKAKSFTLIELMVALAIIAILVSLLMPSLGRARKTARIAVCSGNLGQIGTAMYIYASDNKFHLPGHYILNNGSTQIIWDDYLGAGYDGRNLTYAQQKASDPGEPEALYQCPLDTSGDSSPYHKKRSRSYSANQGKLDGTKASKRGWIEEGNAKTLKTTLFKRPSNSILLFERHHIDNKLGKNKQGTLRVEHVQKSTIDGSMIWGHAKYKSNYLFADGSVRHLNFITTCSGTNKDPWSDKNEFGTLWDCQ